jgi:hypothetical protein
LTVDGYFVHSFDCSILIQYFGDEDIVFIPRTVEIISSYCFNYCKSLSSVSIESGALLRRIESSALSSSSLPSSVIPRTVEIIGSSCFSYCKSLSSVLIESGSLLRQIEARAFLCTKLRSVSLPVDVQSIAANAFPDSCKVLRK